MTDETQAFDGGLPIAGGQASHSTLAERRSRTRIYPLVKRALDVAAALAAMPIVIAVAIILTMINPISNRGPLIFAQTRMGRRCRPFRAYKFRTMHAVENVARGPNDPLEIDRITPLGRFLRKTRIDEFPQFINVLMGEMSLIGPRPDYWEHAVHYADTIPGYRRRHAMRPGITGLAQVDNGYAEGVDATTVKTRHDLRYISEASLSMDWYIFCRTVTVMFTGFGAR